MKSTTLLALLVGALFVCGLATLWLSVRFYFSTKEREELQSHLLMINRTTKAADALAYEALAYSKSHPEMVPLLRRFNMIRPPASTNTVNPQPSPPEASDL